MNGPRLAELSALHARCGEAAERFHADHDEMIEAYRDDIRDGIDFALAQIRLQLGELSGANEVVLRLGDDISGYVSWMQWALWDLPVLAVATAPDHDEFRDAVAACGLVYISIRLFDDVLDQHHAYKGRHETVLGSLTGTYPDAAKVQALSTLAGLLVCFEGLRRLAAGGDAGPRHVHTAERLGTVLDSVRNAVVGAVMEHTDIDDWDAESYERMVRLKNVDYWRSLYAALDPEGGSPLSAFLEEYYAVAQYLNDVEDYEEDLRRGQPNVLAVGVARNEQRRSFTPSLPASRSAAVEEDLADRFLDLGARLDGLPPVERAVAETKLADSLSAASKAGLFAADTTPSPVAAPAVGPRVRLFWYSHLDNVIEEAGVDALVDVVCAVCGDPERRSLFAKQGFRYHRCLGCSHVYVSPRITADLQHHMLAELDELAFEDKYLEVQRIYAETTCEMLRRRSPGPRLLDIGFGRGYLLQMAQVHGFEVHGVDSSAVQAAELAPQFGDRVAARVVGRDPIPWTDMDVVVMSHVLEHLPDPASALDEVRSVLVPGGWLYLAVPDMGSMDFRIFGKTWDVISPLVHLQYFTEGSLQHLLERCGFEAVERVRHPRIRDEISPRWMRLMRRLGGDELGELAYVARVPGVLT